MNELEQRGVTPATTDWFSRWLGDMETRWPNLLRASGWDAFEAMRVEEFRDGNTLVVKADMPGLDPDKDVEISVGDHSLRIHAERRQTSKVEEDHGFRSEIRYGEFVRTLPLPVGATGDDVKATYKDGVLEVRVPVDKHRADACKVPVERV